MTLTYNPDRVEPVDLTDEEMQNTVFASCEIPPQSRQYFVRKYLVERILAAILLILFLPILAVLGILIKITSRGSIIYSQQRTGENGESFTIYKLRSMFQDIENRSGKIWSSSGDYRVTKLGRFLRFTHLDEIPQLYNVVKGEMTLVGPRPERPEFVQVLIEKVDGYYCRHSMRPGITGLAQIYLPPDDSVDSVKKKIRHDLIYMRTACFTLDLRIWICTALRLVGIRHGLGPKLLGLNQQLASFKRPADESSERTQPAGARYVFNPYNRPAKPKGPRKDLAYKKSREMAVATDSSDSYSFGSN